jgi:hypothetical protein
VEEQEAMEDDQNKQDFKPIEALEEMGIGMQDI